jgi:peptide/nickel transport system ATP-binding protein
MSQTTLNEPVLIVEDLAVTYETRRGDVKAVQGITFDIRRGEAMGLVGESGCGKSTAALAIMRYLSDNARVPEGRILFQGENLLEKSERELQPLRGNKIAMVYQDPMTTLNPSLRIGDQLIEVLMVHNEISRREARKRCIEMLDMVQMPDPAQVMERYPHQISGGQQQRVVIAMALLNDPALLIMDEPTTALDVTVEANVLDQIRDLRQEFDTAILYISHNLGVVARVCDRVGVMYAGELMEQASVHDIFLEPMHPYTKSLLGCIPTVGTNKAMAPLCPIPGRVPAPDARPKGCVFEPRCMYAKTICVEEHPPLVGVGPRRRVRCFQREIVWQPPETALTMDYVAAAEEARDQKREPILDVDHLKTYYIDKPSWLGRLVSNKKETRVKAVDDVSLELQPQHILGVVGESGCGKTSLAKTVAGLVSPTDGTIEFMEVDVTEVVEKRPKGILQELQMVFQNPDSTLNPTQTVRQIIGRPLKVSNLVSRSEIDDEVRRWLEAVNLGENYLNRKPRQMSGGEKQRVAIARAFASRPEMVVCDEPVSSLDVSVQCAVLNTLLSIQGSHGTSLLFISHDLSMVRYLCDYIIVMYLGKVCEVGPAEQLFAPPYHPYTEALLSAVPVPDPSVEQARIRLEGSVPSALNPPSGCRFHTRCQRKVGEICETAVPPELTTGGGHKIYCHIPLEELEQMEPVIQGTKEQV